MLNVAGKARSLVPVTQSIGIVALRRYFDGSHIASQRSACSDFNCFSGATHSELSPRKPQP